MSYVPIDLSGIEEVLDVKALGWEIIFVVPLRIFTLCSLTGFLLSEFASRKNAPLAPPLVMVLLSVVFSTVFSVFGDVVKHGFLPFDILRETPFKVTNQFSGRQRVEVVPKTWHVKAN